MVSDNKAYKEALGSFATGITVVTVRAPDGTVLGMTVNSFSSVSLDPPLVLWCLDKSAALFPIIKKCDAFCVSVLSEDQEEISNRFAVAHQHDVEGLALTEGVSGVSYLSESPTNFQCSVYAQHDAGDHLIIVGRVEAFGVSSDAKPLLYYKGSYMNAEG
ncbi:MAG: flavin reductase family protein [Parvibaculaceae bacterium]|nr:flavin reductase family protein [Parvibaculaceae bacterium]